MPEEHPKQGWTQVELKFLILSLAFCCLSNSFVSSRPLPPPIKEQIAQTHFTQFGHRPPAIHGDLCRKWIKQLPISVPDGHGHWFFHPAQTTCYMYESQAHHPY